MFALENGGVMFLRIRGWLSTACTALYCRRQKELFIVTVMGTPDVTRIQNFAR
jgi:hypothetical protein